MTIDEKVEILLKRYEESRRNDDYEPEYVIPPYDEIFAYVGKPTKPSAKSSFFTKKKVKALRNIYGDDLTDKEILTYFEDNTLDPLLSKDGSVIKSGLFPSRVVHDGYKVGTTSWIFMGRKNSPIVPVSYHDDKLFAVKRTVPPEITKLLRPTHPELGYDMWCAYDLNGKYKIEIGPCFSLDQIMQAAVTGGHFTIRSFDLGDK